MKKIYKRYKNEIMSGVNMVDESFLKKFSRATFAVLDRAGHNLQIEQENIFNSMINEWLMRIED